MAFNLPGFKNPVPVNIKVGNITEGELLRFRAFNDWQKTLKASLDLQQDPDHPFHKAPYELKSIEIQSVDWFAKNTDRAFVGFVKLEADVRNEEGKSLPGIAFLRGMSVAMLMILRPSDSKTERWVIMTEQPRIPAGSLR